MTRDEAISKIRAAFDDIRAEYPVRSLSIFGSTARNEATEDSDVDVLVTFSQPIGLFTFCGVRLKLVDILGCEVDLVTHDAIRPEWRTRILAESVNVA